MKTYVKQSNKNEKRLVHTHIYIFIYIERHFIREERTNYSLQFVQFCGKPHTHKSMGCQQVPTDPPCSLLPLRARPASSIRHAQLVCLPILPHVCVQSTVSFYLSFQLSAHDCPTLHICTTVARSLHVKAKVPHANNRGSRHYSVLLG